MKKLDLYIIKKFLGTFFFSILLLIVVVIIFDLSEKIDDFIDNHAPLNAVIFDYYLNFIPYFVNLFLHLFTFIAVIFFTSKMAADTEIVAILSSGISFKRLLFPYLISALVLVIMSFYLSNFLIPKTNKILVAFEKTYIKNKQKKSEINIHIQTEPGTYVYVESFNNIRKTGNKFSYEKINEKKQLYYKLTSNRILWDSVSNKWILKDYFIRTIDSLDEKIYRGKKLDTIFKFKPKDFSTAKIDVKTLSYFELKDFIKEEKIKGSKNITEYLVLKNKRIADPFSIFIFTLIGVALSCRKTRGGTGMHIGIGIGLAFSFIFFMQVSTVFATMGSLSPLIAVWIPNIIFGVISAYFLNNAPK